MEIYNIFEVAQHEYVALPADEEGPNDNPDGQVGIKADSEWMPGSQQDLRVALSDRAIEKWLETKRKIQ